MLIYSETCGWNIKDNAFCFSVKAGLSSSKNNSFYLLQWKPVRNNEKWFLFHLKSSFGSQDI